MLLEIVPAAKCKIPKFTIEAFLYFLYFFYFDFAVFALFPPLLPEADLPVAAEPDFLSFDFSAEVDFPAFDFDEAFCLESAEDLAVSDFAAGLPAFELGAVEPVDFEPADFDFADLPFSSIGAALSSISLTAPTAALMPPIAAPVAASVKTSPTTFLALSITPEVKLLLPLFLIALFALLFFAPSVPADLLFDAFVALVAAVSLPDLLLSFLSGIFFPPCRFPLNFL
jgi:hypothetical protein